VLEFFEFIWQQWLAFVAGDGLERKHWFSSYLSNMALTTLQKRLLCCLQFVAEKALCTF